MDFPVALKFAEAVPTQDRLQRSLRELRMSVIDRCNFRCTYCMPADSLQGRGVFLPLQKLLTDHEIRDLVQAFVELGVRKLRLTGGEPLLRPDIFEIASYGTQKGLRMVMAPNGTLITEKTAVRRTVSRGSRTPLPKVWMGLFFWVVSMGMTTNATLSRGVSLRTSE